MVAVLAAGLMIPASIQVAESATYALPNAPLNVTSYLGNKGVVVRWTPAENVLPAVTGYVVSAGPGSCPIFVSAKSNSVVTMPVVDGQPGGTPVVQAVNSYGFSKPTVSNQSYTKAQLATVYSPSAKTVQILQLSDLHGAIKLEVHSVRLC